MMQSQVEVLEGKQRALQRYHAPARTVGAGSARLRGRGSPNHRPAADAMPAGRAPGCSRPGANGAAPAAPIRRPASHEVLAAQEELRREIARQMHDGPAQSIANIALQAQIVERLFERDPKGAQVELNALRDDGRGGARGDQGLHLRRPTHGPRRPRPGTDPAPVGRRADQATGCDRSLRIGRDRTGVWRQNSRAPYSASSTTP